ncbi:MAG: alpha/beta hydrolase [Kiritimatiellia bacterium]|jgi:pimeloyl-ACP methyl ester carboxylesterase|nr:alpha/beta hydrolase [Kiritimatiellia bacterium]MDX9794003.1 alpha/beta hydrolase [Kiritimatiellia bacterium]NLC82110.1 alpha/beta hydrolase [Lentisphaerota bacterium]
MGSLFIPLLLVGAAWLGMNLLHGLWVGLRRRAWEKLARREPNGLLPDAAAYRIGNGPVALLFIHGFADTPCIWRRMTRRLAEGERFTCRAMRLPGSAETAAHARCQSLALWRTQVADELVRLRETHEAVWIVGHSLGGALALDAALRLPDLVDGVAVFAPLIDVARARCPLLPPRVWFALARVALCLSPTFESPFAAQGVAEDDPSFTFARDRFIPFCVYRALFRLISEIRPRAASLACPLFALTASHDSVVDTAAAQRWLAACPGPKSVRDLPEASHVIPLCAEWEALADEMAAFILAHPRFTDFCFSAGRAVSPRPPQRRAAITRF